LNAAETITVASLKQAGIVRRLKDGVRLLSDGEISQALKLEVAGASKAAITKIEQAGGSVTVL